MKVRARSMISLPVPTRRFTWQRMRGGISCASPAPITRPPPPERGGRCGSRVNPSATLHTLPCARLILSLLVERPGSEQHPAAVEHYAREHHEVAGKRSDCCAAPQLIHARERRRMDRQLAVVRQRLDRKDPRVIAAQAPANGPRIADPVLRIVIVV